MVLPTYNEKDNIEEMIERLTATLDPLLHDRYELIVVDDDSSDRTWEHALALTGKFPKLRVIRRQGERGLSTAVIRGWQVAVGRVLAVIDADLQHPPEILQELWRQIEDGMDLAVGSRHVQGGGVSDWSLFRRLLSRGAQFLALLILPEVAGRVSDPMSGYFMVRRAALQGVTLNPLGYKILLEVLGRGNIRSVSEAPYVFQERRYGKSNVTWKLYLQYFWHLLRLRWVRASQSRFLRFSLVGLSGMVVDMAILFLLSDPVTLAWGLTRSKAIAAEVALLNNFLWNDLWTFGDLSKRQRDFARTVKRLLKFNLICATGLVLNVALLNLLFNVFEMNRYLANGIAILVVAWFNYWFNAKLNWAVTEARLTK